MRTIRKKAQHGPALRVLATALVPALLAALLAALLLAGTALAAAKPGTPTAKTPKGTAATATPTFTWTKAKGATRYELRVYQGSTQELKKTGLTTLSWTSSEALPTNVGLTWKVRAGNASGTGAWSKSLTFKLVPPRPAPLVMVPVPAGAFQRDGTPTNTSSVSAFSMSEKEITVGQFTAVTGLANPSSHFTTVVNGPVQMANWYHALVFCNKLSMSEGLTPVYTIGGSTNPAVWIAANRGLVPNKSNAAWDAATANWSAGGYRLPTEMEWMWAAMGATGGTTGYLKAFAGSTGSNAIGEFAWYSDNAGSTTHQVGTRTANELGLYDMSGNVVEWCWDWFADVTPAGAQTDYRGPASGTSRVVRGGSWGYGAASCSVARRYGDNPYVQGSINGFRVVRP